MQIAKIIYVFNGNAFCGCGSIWDILDINLSERQQSICEYLIKTVTPSDLHSFCNVYELTSGKKNTRKLPKLTYHFRATLNKLDGKYYNVVFSCKIKITRGSM